MYRQLYRRRISLVVENIDHAAGIDFPDRLVVNIAGTWLRGSRLIICRRNELEIHASVPYLFHRNLPLFTESGSERLFLLLRQIFPTGDGAFKTIHDQAIMLET